MSVSVSFDVERSIRMGDEVKPFAWEKIVEARMAQRYPDLIIKFESIKDKTVTFTMKFNNRPTCEADIRSRFFDFIADYPTMDISKLEIKLLA